MLVHCRLAPTPQHIIMPQYVIIFHPKLGNCEEELPKKPVGRLSVICWPTVGRLSADCWPTVGRLSADRRPTGFPQNIDYQSADKRPTVGRQLVMCR